MEDSSSSPLETNYEHPATNTVESEINSANQNLNNDENALTEDQKNNNAETIQGNENQGAHAVSSVSNSSNKIFSIANDEDEAFAYGSALSPSSALQEPDPDETSNNSESSTSTLRSGLGVTAKNSISLTRVLQNFPCSHVPTSASTSLLEIYCRNPAPETLVQSASSHSILILRQAIRIRSDISINALLSLGEEEITASLTQPEETNRNSEEFIPELLGCSPSLPNWTLSTNNPWKLKVGSNESLVKVGDETYPRSTIQNKLRCHSYPKTNYSDIIIADHSALVALQFNCQDEDDSSNENSNSSSNYYGLASPEADEVESEAERYFPSSQPSEIDFDYIEEEYEALEEVDSNFLLDEPDNAISEVRIEGIDAHQRQEFLAQARAVQDIANSIRLLNDQLDFVLGIVNDVYAAGGNQDQEVSVGQRIITNNQPPVGVIQMPYFQAPPGDPNFPVPFRANRPGIQDDSSSSSSEEDMSTEPFKSPISTESKVATIGNKYDCFRVTEKPRAAPGHKFVVSAFGIAAREANRRNRKILPWLPTQADRLEHMIRGYTSNQSEDEQEERLNRTVNFETNNNDGNENQDGGIHRHNRSQSASTPRLKSCMKISREVIGESIPKTISWSANPQIRDLDDTGSLDSEDENSNENNPSASGTSKKIPKTRSCPGMFHDKNYLDIIKLKISSEGQNNGNDNNKSNPKTSESKPKKQKQKSKRCPIPQGLKLLCCLRMNQKSSDHELPN